MLTKYTTALVACDLSSALAEEHTAVKSANSAQIRAIECGITLCLGAGRTKAADPPYTVYICGKMRTSPDWGLFSSADAGDSWVRISYYPAGIFEQPTCMAASRDSFATVIVGFGGNSFVVGTPVKHDPSPTPAHESR